MTLTQTVLCYAALCATLAAVRRCRLSTPFLTGGGWVVVALLSVVSAPLLACPPAAWEGVVLHLCGPVALTGLIAALFAGPTLPAPLAHRGVAPAVLCALLFTVDISSAAIGEYVTQSEARVIHELMLPLGIILASGQYVYSQVAERVLGHPPQQTPARFWPPVLGFVAVRWAHNIAVIELHEYLTGALSGTQTGTLLLLNALHGCALWYCLWSDVEVGEWYHAPICYPMLPVWTAVCVGGRTTCWFWSFCWDPRGTVCRTFLPRGNPVETQAVLRLQLELEIKKVELELRNTPQAPPQPQARARGRPRKLAGNVLSLEQVLEQAPPKVVKPLVVKPPAAMCLLLFKPLDPPQAPVPPEPVEPMETEKGAKKRPLEAEPPARRTRPRK